MPDFTMIFENTVKPYMEVRHRFFCIWKDIYALKRLTTFLHTEVSASKCCRRTERA